MFYLIGSRFFGTHRPDSDWDYVGEKNLENQKLCETLGMKEVPGSPSPSMMRYWGMNHDILLVDDLPRQLRIRDEIARFPNLSKEERQKKMKEIANGMV